MLGALFSFLGFVLVYYWWTLRKRFINHKKGVDDMPITQFCVFGLLNFIILGFILTCFFAVIPEFLPRSTRHFMENNIEISFIAVFIIVSCWTYYRYKQYAEAKKNNGDVITKIEDVDL